MQRVGSKRERDLYCPYSAGTKLRLPKDIAATLDEFRPMLDSVHYEGVHYEYQDENAAQPAAR